MSLGRTRPLQFLFRIMQMDIKYLSGLLAISLVMRIWLLEDCGFIRFPGHKKGSLRAGEWDWESTSLVRTR